MIMNITERSKEYAKGKALDAITAAIEQAYADGYIKKIGESTSGKLTLHNMMQNGLKQAPFWCSESLRR